MPRSNESGFTLIEMLITFFILSIVTTVFMQAAFSGTRGSDTARSVTRVTQEARLGLNRMIRDTREATLIEDADADGYTVKIDFDSNGTYENPNSAGDTEILTYEFNSSDRQITLNGELLVNGAREIAGKDMFGYSSNFLTYDWNADGVTTVAELDDAPIHGVTGVGNNNDTLDYPELSFVSNVLFNFRVVLDDHTERFYGGAQLRNRR
jgi:prepilin-type N-terminal cleavage/methylation domain-containing protein